MRSRRTARVMVFDAAGRVLLIRCVAMRSDGEFRFWLAPGGEIEAGETPMDARGGSCAKSWGLRWRWWGRCTPRRPSLSTRAR